MRQDDRGHLQEASIRHFGRMQSTWHMAGRPRDGVVGLRAAFSFASRVCWPWLNESSYQSVAKDPGFLTYVKPMSVAVQ